MTTLPLIDAVRRPDTTTLLPLDEYDYIIVSFSGGKDSVALALHLLDLGVPKDKIQLWHQLIDGADKPLMDWPCTESYCTAFGKAFGLRTLFQWRHGGFEREMCKTNDRIAPVSFQRQDGTVATAGGVRGKIATRRMFPQQTADLSVRWCSSALKIDVMGMAVNNEPAFKTAKILVLTGERRQESAARSRYAEMEQHRCNTKSRRVDHWRAGIDWTEERVWEFFRRYGVIPHPCYRLGFSRCSCKTCIFIGADEWATNAHIDPANTEKLASYEDAWGRQIRRGVSIRQQVEQGTVFRAALDTNLVALAMGRDYPEDQILLPPGAEWSYPAGAFKGGAGPT